MHLSCAPLTTSKSWSWGSMKVCGGRSVGWIAEAWKWPLRKPRLCSSRTRDPFSTRGPFSESRRSSGKQALSTWGLQLDRKLSIGKHLKIATAKAIQCGANLTRLMPNIGGPREARRRLMASVVHSKLLYAAPVWANALQNHAIQRRLFSAQRSVALRIVSTYINVSMSAVLVLASVPPIDLLAEEWQ